ncbi:outer membrane protein assembly factor [Sphingomonas parva]|uniref:Outer membrane protein assembly factor n=1 Tax=Sphingomonas parva TaxID=2555898 RepID=A0A4Y8ZX09_9SPHN|nr:BamA/TamA family outer membrane protein [Sphingomonas parva]TFI59026.1 outer membrane protein assembly factor [Sphingomonas parva]
MFRFSAGWGAAAALAAGCLPLCPAPAAAQDAPEPAPPPAPDPFAEIDAPLDPSAPLDPMPDIGVDWPEMEGQDSAIPEAPQAGVADAASERLYAIDLAGLETELEQALRPRFDALSTLAQNRDDPANAAQIDRRAREDADLLAELLRSRGYYDALVQPRVEAPVSAGGPVRVTLEAEPGPLYRFADVRLPGLDEAGADAAALRDAFGVRAQDPVDAGKVTEGEAALRTELGRRGYAFADVGELDVAVDHEARTAVLTLPVEPNGARAFGRIIVEGRPLFSAGHIQTIARFDPGQGYTAAMVEDLRRALIATGLVSSVAIRPVESADRKTVDLAVALEPAPMRTIAGEAGYGTGEGIRVEASWQHRNLIPPEGAVTFRGVAGTREQLVGAVLRRNNFLRRDQVLTAQIAASHVDRPGFEARSFFLAGALERQTNIIWQKKWTWSVGGELIASDERDVRLDTGTTRSRTFFIGALPATLSYDGSNDLLDPTEGFRLSGRFSPEASFQGSPFGYSRAQIDATFYQPVTDTVTIAGRTRLGTIFGASRDRIAPSRRFYAGGGGSVRGYGFQRLGPRDPVFDDPIGGRSLAEFSIEARVRWGDWGFVPFLDAGNIYTSPLPEIDDLRFGAGLGLRYHTRFGPIRVDVGTPLDRRSGDDRIAVYVSLGQAF